MNSDSSSKDDTATGQYEDGSNRLYEGCAVDHSITMELLGNTMLKSSSVTLQCWHQKIKSNLETDL